MVRPRNHALGLLITRLVDETADAKMGKDSFTKYTLAVALHVRPEKAEEWVGRGWLKTREVQAGVGKRMIIDAQDFCDFCKRHSRDVVGNRLTKERLEFVYYFAFPPSHADLLPVRGSKKEREAYESQLDQEERRENLKAENDGGAGDGLGTSDSRISMHPEQA